MAKFCPRSCSHFFNPNWYELWRQEKCLSLAPPISIFCQFNLMDVNFHQQKKVWKFLIKNNWQNLIQKDKELRKFLNSNHPLPDWIRVDPTVLLIILWKTVRVYQFYRKVSLSRFNYIMITVRPQAARPQATRAL